MEKIDHYEIVSILGKGGFGTVYKVRNTLIGNREEALKKFNFDDDNENIKKSFRKEVISSKISHPNICEIFNVNEDQAYITMRYIEGVSLKEIIQHSILSWVETCYIAKKVCDALALSHSKGIIHRDIKPSNILIDIQGYVYLVDFGIASLKDELLASRSNSETFGIPVGTLSYMAPECFKEVIPTKFMDIYALGVVMYYCVTGLQPFDRPTESSNIYERMKNIETTIPTKPSELNNKIPENVETIICQAMEKIPENRYESASEMLHELEIALKQRVDSVVQKALSLAVRKTMDLLPYPNKVKSQTTSLPGAMQKTPDRNKPLSDIDKLNDSPELPHKVLETQSVPPSAEGDKSSAIETTRTWFRDIGAQSTNFVKRIILVAGFSSPEGDKSSTNRTTRTISRDVGAEKEKSTNKGKRITLVSGLIIASVFLVFQLIKILTPVQALSLRLDLSPAELLEQAEIMIDGKSMTEAALNPGEHNIRISADNYKTLEGKIWLAKNHNNSYSAILEPQNKKIEFDDQTHMIIDDMLEYEKILQKAIQNDPKQPFWVYSDLGLIYEIYHRDISTANKNYSKAGDIAETLEEIGLAKERKARTSK